MCFEWNDYDNQTRGQQVRDACASANLVFTIWLTRPFDAASVRQACLESGAAGVSLEGEIPGYSDAAVDWQACVNAIADLNIHKSVVTNFAPFTTPDGLPDPAKARPLVEAGWACLTECYLPENQNLTPEAQDFYARAHLGWSETQPVLGLYEGFGHRYTLDDYPTRNQYRNWSVWDSGEVLV